MDNDIYDVIVVGGGIIGTYTANRLVSENCKVLLIDQFSPPYSNGSSKGRSRGAQKVSFSEHSDTLKMMRDFSLAEWAQLDAQFPGKFIRMSSHLLIGRQGDFFLAPKDEPGIQNESQVTIQVLNRNDLSKKFPNLIVPDNYAGLLELNSFSLFADKIITFLKDEFVKLGGKLMSAHVKNIQPTNTIKVHCSSDVFTSRKVLLATGPWSNTFLSMLDLPVKLQTKHTRLGYWKFKNPDLFDQFPTVAEICDGQIIWSSKAPEYGQCLKIIMSGDSIEDPGQVNAICNAGLTEQLQAYVKHRFDHLENMPVSLENCVVSFPPDLKPLIGSHPKNPNVVIGVGMCGIGGFSFSPAVSAVLCDVLCGRSPRFNIDEFDLSRFM